MTDHSAAIRAAIQALLNSEGDGYVVGQMAIAMGLERINSEGHVEAVPWVWAPEDQPSWQTTALLHEGLLLRDEADITDD